MAILKNAARRAIGGCVAMMTMLAALALTATSAKAQPCPDAGTVFTQQRITQYAGGFTGQLDPSNAFGEAVANIGDLDGDGVVDLAVGVGRDDDGGPNRGAVWILFMNNNGTVRAQQKISSTQGGFAGPLDNGDRFGVSLANIGDIDNDGVSDLAVGAHLDDDGGTDRGAFWILFLNANGTVRAHQKISDTQGGFAGVLADSDIFGFSLSNIGDLDGDGVADMAVGAPQTADGGLNRGAVWILFMNSSGTVRDEQKISSTQGGFTGALDNSDLFGFSATSMGDLDENGVADLAIGAVQDDDGGPDRGAVWILFMNSTGTVLSHQKISDTQGGFSGTLDDTDLIGISVACLGDLDNNGVNDLVMGSERDDDGGIDRGALWFLYMNSNGTVASHLKISQTSGGFGDSLLDGGNLSRSVASLGDINGDGRIELAVGAHANSAQANRGEVWIFSLNDCSIPPVITQQPASVLLGLMGGLTQFAVAADGSPTLAYQWRRDGVNLVNSASFLGVNTPTLTVVAADAQIGAYDCVVSNAFGSATTSPAILGLRAPCPADFNRDGVANSQDFFNFLTAFFAGCP